MYNFLNKKLLHFKSSNIFLVKSNFDNFKLLLHIWIFFYHIFYIYKYLVKNQDYLKNVAILIIFFSASWIKIHLKLWFLVDNVHVISNKAMVCLWNRISYGTWELLYRRGRQTEMSRPKHHHERPAQLWTRPTTQEIWISPAHWGNSDWWIIEFYQMYWVAVIFTANNKYR